MPTIDDVFGSNEILKAADLPHGRSIPVVIESTTVRRFDDGPKIELSFRGKQKRLLANKTNARSIATVLRSEDYEAWPGRTVFLLRTKTDFQGRQVDCIRVDEAPPVQPASQMAQPGGTQQQDTSADPGGFHAETAQIHDQPAAVDVPF